MKDCWKIRAVVFDLDGTLLNTLPDIGASANRALRRAGLPELPVENYRGLIGHGIRALFRLAVPEGTPDDVYEKALACQAAGIEVLYAPEENVKELTGDQRNDLKGIKIVPVRHVKDVMDVF